jgi:hypothetical protein
MSWNLFWLRRYSKVMLELVFDLMVVEGFFPRNADSQRDDHQTSFSWPLLHFGQHLPT